MISKTLQWIKANPFYILLTLYLITYIPLLDTTPPVVIDESWYAGTASNVAQTGKADNINFFARGGDQLYLYSLLLGGWFKYLGTSLIAGRIFSLIIGALCLKCLWTLFKKSHFSKSLSTVLSALYILSNISYILFRRIRPEPLLILFILLASIALLNYLNTSRKKDAGLCGLWVSLGFFTHPNAAPWIITIGVALLITDHKNSYKGLLSYSLSASLTSLAYALTWPLVKTTSLSAMISDILFQSNRAGSSSNLFLTLIANTKEFIHNYALGVKRLLILIVETIGLATGLLHIKHKNSTTLLLTISLATFILALTLFTPFVRSQFILYLPFALLGLGYLWKTLNPSGALKLSLLTVIILYGLNSLAGNLFVITKHLNTAPHSTIKTSLAPYLNPDIPTLFPGNLWLASTPTHNSHCIEAWWFRSPHQTLMTYIDSQKQLLIILPETPLDAHSPLTGNKGIITNPDALQTTQDRLNQTIQTKGEKIKTFHFNGYGTINIWSLSK